MSGNWGGSTTAVIKGTQNPIAAAKFAEFLNTDPATTAMFNTVQNLFPSTTALLASPSFTGLKDAFFGGQQVNKLFAGISSTVNTGLAVAAVPRPGGHGLDLDVGKALASKGDVAAATDQWESQLTAYAKNQGFNVTVG